MDGHVVRMEEEACIWDFAGKARRNDTTRNTKT
jgi:hypothetical protein